MAKKQTIECDNCHNTEDADAVDGWLQVVTMVGSQEAMLKRVEADEEPDWGDFCSLRCLGEWALARDLLRSLDEGGDTA